MAARKKRKAKTKRPAKRPAKRKAAKKRPAKRKAKKKAGKRPGDRFSALTAAHAKAVAAGEHHFAQLIKRELTKGKRKRR